jgi:hypothetical protein
VVAELNCLAVLRNSAPVRLGTRYLIAHSDWSVSGRVGVPPAIQPAARRENVI